MFNLVVIAIVILLLVFYTISKVRERTITKRADAQYFYSIIVSRWKHNAFVLPDETVTCTLPFGNLSVVYPPYGSENEEGECTKAVFVELMNQFIEHDFPVDVPEVNSNYFIVHMPLQKKSAT